MITNQNFRLLLTLAVLVFGFFGCEENKTSLPTIEILQPTNRIFVTVPDTVLVVARVSDPDLKNISVALVDENFINAGLTVNIPVTGPTVQFNAELIISNRQLRSGKYYIRVRASNNDEETSDWQEVQLRQEPLSRLGYGVAIGQPFDTELFLSDTSNQFRTLYAGNLDTRRLLINGGSQQITLVPNQLGNLSSYQLPQGSPSWQVAALTSGGIATFLAGASFFNETWVSLYDGRLIRINESGGTSFSIQLPYNLLGRQITGHQDVVVVVGTEQSGSSGRIVALNKTGGGIISESSFSGTVTAIAQINENTSILALRGLTGSTQVLSYEIPSGNLSPLLIQNLSTTGASVFQLIKDNSGSQFFALTSMGVYKWTPNQQNFTLLTSENFNSSFFVWDEVDNVILAGSGTNLKTINPNTGTSTTIASFSKTILSAAIWYNR